MRIDLRAPNLETLRSAAALVRDGGLVLYPTDTIYGLGCDARQPASVRRLVELKGRSEGKGMLVLIPSTRWLPELSKGVPDEGWEILERFWPGPLTVLLEAAEGIPEGLCGYQGKIGIRWPASTFLRSWLDLLDGPLVSTSANPSGTPYDGSPKVLKALYEGRVDLLLDAGELPARQPSTVVDLTMRPFSIVRDGERAAELRKFLV